MNIGSTHFSIYIIGAFYRTPYRLFPNLNTNLPLLLPLRKRLGEKVNSW